MQFYTSSSSSSAVLSHVIFDSGFRIAKSHALLSPEITTLVYFSGPEQKKSIARPPDVQDTSAVAHFKGLFMALMLYYLGQNYRDQLDQLVFIRK